MRNWKWLLAIGSGIFAYAAVGAALFDGASSGIPELLLLGGGLVVFAMLALRVALLRAVLTPAKRQAPTKQEQARQIPPHVLEAAYARFHPRCEDGEDSESRAPASEEGGNTPQ